MSPPPSPSAFIRKSPEKLFREHIAAMHVYANELSAVLGIENPIVRRIHDCAASNARILDALAARKKKGKAA